VKRSLRSSPRVSAVIKVMSTTPKFCQSQILCAVTLIVLSASAFGQNKPFLGPIPVQYVQPNTDVTLDMHRFYLPSRDTKLDFATKDDVDLAFDAASLQLHARTKKNGLAEVVLKSGDLTTILTLASQPATPAHRFAFKPSSVEAGVSPAQDDSEQPTRLPLQKKIFIGGSFNGWSKDKTAMDGPNESGEYTIDLPLEPGHYAYKFAVHGNWVVDPNNSQTEDNGMGDKNSVLVIAGEKRADGPTIYADRLSNETLTIRATAPVTRVSAVSETANSAASVPAQISPNRIEIPIPKKEVGFIRVVATDGNGTPSNVVRCAIDGGFHWQDAVMYYAFTDRFADGDKANDHPVENANVLPPANYHGGDLRGVREKIDNGYFESLGVNTVWVAPLNKNPDKAYQEYPEPHRWYTGYHGYWPVSSTEIDPHIGTDKDLKALVDDAHAHGMKVIADLVLHHVHQEHPWWKQHRDWFGTLDLPNGKKNLRLWDEQQFTTWFEPYLPSFDFSKDAPVKALIDNSIWWLNTYKLDGFRLDAVKHILPSFWWKFRAALRERVDRRGNSPLYLVGETFKDRSGIMSFVGPNMLDGQFDFPLYDQIKDSFALTTGDMKALDDALTSSEKVYGKETLMSPLVGNHDKGRFMAYADGDLPDAKIEKEEEVGWKKPPKVDDATNYKKLELAQAFLMSIDGVPMIYYGDEFGMTGAGDPDNRRDMRFGDQISADEKGVLENFKKLGAIRKAHPALHCGSRRTLQSDQNIYAFVRAYLDDRVVVIFNRGTTEAKVDTNVSPELNDGAYADALNGNSVKVESGKLRFTLPPQQAAFITKAK
jgi:cyclomaltodextrinase / maltogenic alpha-amylase / neopullulanase